MWKFLIKAGVSVVLLALLLHGLDPGELFHKMLTVDRWAFITAALCYWAVCIPAALRWSIVLRAMGYERPFRVTLPIVLIGYFFNLTLVSSVGGDVVRMWEINRSGLPPAEAFISVTIDRLIQYLAHILIVIAALPASFQLVSDPAIRRGVVLFVAASALGLVVATMLDRLPLVKLRLRLADVPARFSADLRRVLLVPSRAMSTVFLALCTQCGVVLVVIILAWGLALPVTWLQCAVIVPLSLVATAIPVSIGGWGVREGAFVTGFGLVGVSASDALVLSVLFGILNFLVRLPGVLVWLTVSNRDRSLPRARPTSEILQQPAASAEQRQDVEH
jgi:uncharacterized membrane protein YbhN (UPF0104 family)